jgi:hypothetical protein
MATRLEWRRRRKRRRIIAQGNARRLLMRQRIAIVPPMVAVANAIYHAVGVRMTEMPKSPLHVLKAILAKCAATDSQPAAAD